MAKARLRLAPLALILGIVAPPTASAQHLVSGSGSARPETQDLRGEVLNEKNLPLPGAVCTLTGKTLPDEGLSVTTGDKGLVDFPGLVAGTYSLTCAALGYEPLVQSNLEITDEQPAYLQLVMTPEIVVKQQVEVHEKAGQVSAQSAAPPAALASPQLAALPLVEQKFKAALPLLPGVVRTPDGKINIKGAVESQGLLLVDSAEMVDPVTGAFAIDIPIDAVESLQVYKSTYRADYGRFSGGLTTLETKAPSGQFHYELNDFLPTPRIKSGHVVGIADDEPRFYLTGPLVSNKLNFSEALTYDFLRQPVRGLPFPNNEIKTQGFTSFTSFQYIASASHLMTVDADIFPRREQYANISSLVPQSASSDYGQKGFSVGWTDRYLFSSGSVLTTLVQFLRFDSNAHGQGGEPMIVTPDGWGGNFFNTYNRRSDQQQFSQTFEWASREWHGKHEPKIGVEFIRRSYRGTSASRRVELRREDGTLAEQIDFAGPGSLAISDTEVGGFIEDHWSFNDRTALQAGLRFSGQSIGEPAAAAPRVGLVFSPDQQGKTIFRAGVGLFYDRVPLLAGDFTGNPERQVTLFNAQGAPLGPPVLFQNAYIKVNENGQQIVPSENRLDSTPHNVTWNLEADREILPSLLVRFSYLSSRTYQQFVVNPLNVPGTQPTLLLSNTGGSRYHEFESTVRFRPREGQNVNFSFVRSRARGDLNTLSSVYVPFEQPVIRPNLFGTLPANVPNRFITWGTFRLPAEMTLNPVFEVHTGFPYSAVDVLQNYVGTPNSLRFPAFASIDFKVTKNFRIRFIPFLKKHKFQIAFSVFNLTNHSNPRDVFSNVTSPSFGQFVGFQHRFYDAYFDVVD